MSTPNIDVYRTSIGMEIRGMHPYVYRSGQWAEITDVRWKRGNLCYLVLFSNGDTDLWPVTDTSAQYEFRGEPMVSEPIEEPGAAAAPPEQDVSDVSLQLAELDEMIGPGPELDDFEANCTDVYAEVQLPSGSCTCFAMFLADDRPTKDCPVHDSDGTNPNSVTPRTVWSEQQEEWQQENPFEDWVADYIKRTETR